MSSLYPQTPPLFHGFYLLIQLFLLCATARYGGSRICFSSLHFIFQSEMAAWLSSSWWLFQFVELFPLCKKARLLITIPLRFTIFHLFEFG